MTKYEALEKLSEIEVFIIDIGRKFPSEVDHEEIEKLRKQLTEIDSFIYNNIE